MMRGRTSAAVAVRQADGGLLLYEEPINPRLYRSRILQLPFLRGLLLLWDMLVLGTRMLAFAASASLSASPSASLSASLSAPAGTSSTETPDVILSAADAAPGTTLSPVIPSEQRIREARPGEVAGPGGLGLAVALVLSLGFAVALFFVAPLALVGAAKSWVGTGWSSLIAEGVARLVILLAYLWIIGRMPSVARVFEYHGAEHKAINTLEAGQPLDVAHVRRASRVHTRCGTGFLLIVMVVSIFIFALVGTPPLALRVLSRIVLIPVVAAIAYELMRLGAANYRLRVVRWLMAPGLALQGLTTREPDDRQMECAIAALERVLRRDGATALERVA